MKKLLLSACAVMVAVGVQAQGTVNFRNFASPGAEINKPIFAADGSTLLEGDQFQAQLFAGESGSSAAELEAVGEAAGFLEGAGAGFFRGGQREIPIDGGADAAVDIRVWDTSVASTFADAEAAGIGYGNSGVFEMPTGNPNADPPGTPVNMEEHMPSGFSLVPEPSVLALGLLGAGVFLLRRRVK